MKIGGVDIQLTEEQLRQLESLIEKPKSKMGRPHQGDKYWYIINNYINDTSGINSYTWCNDSYDNYLYDVGNCYFDKELAEQVALDWQLNEKLRQFSYQNGFDDSKLFHLETIRYFIYFYSPDKEWLTSSSQLSINPGVVYFKDEKSARKAIYKVIIPFCKETPNYRFSKQMFKGELYGE